MYVVSFCRDHDCRVALLAPVILGYAAPRDRAGLGLLRDDSGFFFFVRCGIVKCGAVVRGKRNF